MKHFIFSCLFCDIFFIISSYNWFTFQINFLEIFMNPMIPKQKHFIKDIVLYTHVHLFYKILGCDKSGLIYSVLVKNTIKLWLGDMMKLRDISSKVVSALLVQLHYIFVYLLIWGNNYRGNSSTKEWKLPHDTRNCDNMFNTNYAIYFTSIWNGVYICCKNSIIYIINIEQMIFMQHFGWLAVIIVHILERWFPYSTVVQGSSFHEGLLIWNM